jgi:hypothetical protein
MMYLSSDLVYNGPHEAIIHEHYAIIEEFLEVIERHFPDFSCDDTYGGVPAFSTQASVVLISRCAMMRHPSATEVLKMTDQERRERGI